MFEEQIVRESKRIDDLSSRLRRMEAQQIGRDITHASSPPSNPRNYDLWMDTATRELFFFNPVPSAGLRSTVQWCSVDTKDIPFVPISNFQFTYSATTANVRAAWKKDASKYVIETFSFTLFLDAVGGGTAWDASNKWTINCTSLFSTSPVQQLMQAADLQSLYPSAPGTLFLHNYGGSFWTYGSGRGMFLDFVKTGNPPNLSFWGGSMQYRVII